jgi:GNAT superfamily N-acetyltransferase
MLRNPQTYILDGGGQIFFALDGDEAIGTVASARVSDTTFELAKMAVSPSHQGRGLGRLLGEAAIAYARSQGATMMFLDTSSKLPTAIALYERLGFRHTPPPEPSRYARSDVYMELRLAGD